MFVALLVILCLSKQATLFYYQTKLIETALLEMLLLHFVRVVHYHIRNAFASPEILHMFFCINYSHILRHCGLMCFCFHSP